MLTRRYLTAMVFALLLVMLAVLFGGQSKQGPKLSKTKLSASSGETIATGAVAASVNRELGNRSAPEKVRAITKHFRNARKERATGKLSLIKTRAQKKPTTAVRISKNLNDN